MPKLEYDKIDAFASANSTGNPAACIYLAPGQTLSADRMLAIAKEHQGFVSEVVYCTPLDDGRYHLIYYSAECEVDFCGHGTIACMYHLLRSRAELSARSEVEIVTKMGALTVYNALADQDAVFITAPAPAPAYPGSPVSPAEAAAALGIAVADLDPALDVDMVNAGLNTLLVPLAELDSELALAPDESALKAFCLGHGIDIVLAFTRRVADPAHMVRSRVFRAQVRLPRGSGHRIGQFGTGLLSAGPAACGTARRRPSSRTASASATTWCG